MVEKDILFLTETRANANSLDNLQNFTVFGDPNFPLFQKHGGMAAYVYAQHVTDIRFTKCTLSFALTVITDVVFMVVYVYPPSSPNYKDTDFSMVISEIDYWMSKGTAG